MQALGPVLIVIAIPLLLRWVPRNRLYGFRVPATLEHDQVWFDVNARSARHLLLLGVAMMVGEFLLPPASRTRSLTALAIAGLAAIIIVNWRYANRLARQVGGPDAPAS